MSQRLRPSISVGAGRLANLGAQFLPFFCFFLCAPILTSALGGGRFGALMLLTIVPQIAGQLDFGVTTAGIRLIAHYGAAQQMGSARRVFLEAFVVLSVIGFVYAMALVIFSGQMIAILQLAGPLGDRQGAWAVAASAAWAFASLFGGAAAIVLRAHQRYRELAFIQAGGGVLFWLGATALAWAGKDVASILWFGALTGFFSVVLLLVRSRGLLPEGPTLATGSLLAPEWKYSAGVFVSQASSLLTYHFDKLLVSALVSPVAAGIYTACSNLAAKLLVAVAAISTYSFPQATTLNAAGDLDGIRHMFIEGTRINLSLAVALSIPAMALSGPFVHLWLGEAASSEFAIGFSFLIFGYLLTSASVVAANIASGMGDSRTPAIFSVLGGGGTLLMCALLAPRLGSAGAALGALIGMSQAVVFCGLIARRLGKNSLGVLVKKLWPVSFSASVVGVLLYRLAFMATNWFFLFSMAGIGVFLIAYVGLRNDVMAYVRLRKSRH